MKCPTCQRGLDEVVERDILQWLRKGCKYEEERIWYCAKCGYIFEEDFLFTTE